MIAGLEGVAVSLYQQVNYFEKNHTIYVWFSAVFGGQHYVELTTLLSDPKTLF